jgi:hypothetical protein
MGLQAYKGTHMLNYVNETESARCGTVTSPAPVLSMQYKQRIAGAAADCKPQ